MKILDSRYLGIHVEQYMSDNYWLGLSFVYDKGNRSKHVNVIVDFYKWFLEIRIGKA